MRRAQKPQNSSNLLTFLRKDPQPPISLTQFDSLWDWFIRPLLFAFQEKRTNPQSRELPSLFPANLLAAHRFHARKVFADMSNQSRASFKEAHDATVLTVNQRVFGNGMRNTDNAGSPNNVSKWVIDVCQLNDPLVFPHESKVYESQITLSRVLEIMERNIVTLETMRRQHVLENKQRLGEVDRLYATVMAIEQLPKNLNRIINQTVAT